MAHCPVSPVRLLATEKVARVELHRTLFGRYCREDGLAVSSLAPRLLVERPCPTVDLFPNGSLRQSTCYALGGMVA